MVEDVKQQFYEMQGANYVDVEAEVTENSAVVTLSMIDDNITSCELTAIAEKTKEQLETQYNRVTVVCGTGVQCDDSVCPTQGSRRRRGLTNSIGLNAFNVDEEEEERKPSRDVWIIVGSVCGAAVLLVIVYLLVRNDSGGVFRRQYTYFDMPKGRFL